MINPKQHNNERKDKMNNLFTDEQWQSIQQFDTHRKEHKYTKEDKMAAWFCGAVMIYLICQVLRGVF